jgi:hypothetical protein
MSDAPQQPPLDSGQIVTLIIGGAIGFFGSLVFSVFTLFVIMLGYSGMGGDAITVPLLILLPFGAIAGVIYYIVSQKPTGFVLGLLLGVGFGLLLQGLCVAAVLLSGG